MNHVIWIYYYMKAMKEATKDDMNEWFKCYQRISICVIKSWSTYLVLPVGWVGTTLLDVVFWVWWGFSQANYSTYYFMFYTWFRRQCWILIYHLLLFMSVTSLGRINLIQTFQLSWTPARLPTPERFWLCPLNSLSPQSLYHGMFGAQTCYNSLSAAAFWGPTTTSTSVYFIFTASCIEFLGPFLSNLLFVNILILLFLHLVFR